MNATVLYLVRMLRWRPPSLRFEPEQERRFMRACAPARLRHFIASGVVALLVWNLFLLSDRTMVPDMFPQALHLRLFLFTPVALVLLVIGWRFKGFYLALPSFAQEGVLMLTGVFAALSLGWVLLQTHSPFGIMYRSGLLPILIYGNLVQRFRFRYALVFSAVVLATCAASMVRARLGPQPQPYLALDIPLALLVLLIAGYTLVMNFRMELEERRRFVRHERAADLRQQLQVSQVELHALSRRDPLTGVPNRRHFDEAVQACWNDHLQRRDELALLLIDVDHFKAYNDRYGHPAGDQCLRHVAEVLQREVPASRGTVARWGGEEFIIVLPHTDALRAMALAQALVDAVAALALRHEASPTSASVTISAGVAVATPGQSLHSPDEIIAKADFGLYRAKREGRHRRVLS
jgi:diguanylate cyclase (GGDEF)-like protein